jgi:hypothetical protein
MFADLKMLMSTGMLSVHQIGKDLSGSAPYKRNIPPLRYLVARVEAERE